jgi:hypothetical protein
LVRRAFGLSNQRNLARVRISSTPEQNACG